MEVSSISREIVHVPDNRAPSRDVTEINSAPDGSLGLRSPKMKKTVESPQAPVQPVVNSQSLGLKFTVDETTGCTIISVYDLESQKVIRQIPPEEVLAFIRQLDALKGQILSRHF